jgi:hypothetical protein
MRSSIRRRAVLALATAAATVAVLVLPGLPQVWTGLPLRAAWAAGGPAPASSFDHGYAAWDAVLKAHVDGSGMVDYAALKAEPGLRQFLSAVAAVKPEEVAAWSAPQQTAFYINAYNALTFQTILDAMPVASIRDIKPDPWENSRWTVAGRTVSLNWIEHSKLRRDLKEPRVHFVLVCAAKGCPRLPNRAVLADGLDAQLERYSKGFLTDPAKNRVDVSGKKVWLSRILEWYGGDFVGFQGAPDLPALASRPEKEQWALRTLAKYAGESERAFLSRGDFSVAFYEYDWTLNAR